MVAVIETEFNEPTAVIFEFTPESCPYWEEEGWESREEAQFWTSEECMDVASVYDIDSGVPEFFHSLVDAQQWASSHYSNPIIIN